MHEADLRYRKAFAEWQHEALNSQSSRAVAASRNTIKGQVGEQLAPLLPPMISKYPLSDLKFFGQPVDYICFQGMTEARDGEGTAIEIVFIDIKTGKATLSPIQRKLKAAVEEGRVRWETITI